MRIQKFSRPRVILMAAVVAIITSICVVNATQTITTPNAAFISYTLAKGASGAAITPTTSRSVLVMGCCVGGLVQGVGQVSLQHIPSNGMVWVGLESPSSAAITSGRSATAATHIVFIDDAHQVVIEVASADTIRVHNYSLDATVAANVTLIW